jgi:hypothetical protein
MTLEERNIWVVPGADMQRWRQDQIPLLVRRYIEGEYCDGALCSSIREIVAQTDEHSNRYVPLFESCPCSEHSTTTVSFTTPQSNEQILKSSIYEGASEAEGSNHLSAYTMDREGSFIFCELV